MKVLSLILVIIMVICYGGLCVNANLNDNTKSVNDSSCHNSHHSKATPNQTNLISNKYENKNNQQSSSCCYDALVNAYTKINIYQTDIFIVPAILFKSKLEISKINNIQKHRELREHDPPYFFIQNSAFLL